MFKTKENKSLIPTTNKIIWIQTVIPCLNDNFGDQNLNRLNNSFNPFLPLIIFEVNNADIDAVAGNANKIRVNHKPPVTFSAKGNEYKMFVL